MRARGRARTPGALQRRDARAGAELDFMKRVGGIDLIVNLAQQCAEDEDAFDSLVREGAFDAFSRALQADEDEVVVQVIGLACPLPRRRALRARLAEDGEAVRRLATFMGSSTDESVRGFSGGLCFAPSRWIPRRKGLVEKALPTLPGRVRRHREHRVSVESRTMN